MKVENEVKGTGQTFATKYVIVQNAYEDFKWTLVMPTHREFERPCEAQDYIREMNWNYREFMIMPVMREVLG